jgi:uncharacterized protein
MVVGICTIELYLPNNGSLKEKRQVLKSMKDRLKQRFNISIAEIEDQDLWQKTVIGMACVGNEKSHVHRTMDKALALIRGNPLVEIIGSRFEIV